jgi:serralysin
MNESPNKVIGVCVEKVSRPRAQELAMTNFWAQNKTLRVKFMGGDAAIQKKVKDYALQWNEFSNVSFQFVSDGDAEIRVAFRPTNSSWSALGTDALNIQWFPNETMNFGWLTATTDDDEYSRVVLHEFGHALGCIHEHQSPAAGIPWNKEAVYRYYSESQSWDRATVDQNIFRKWVGTLTQAENSPFDPKSIMLYPIPKELTDGVFEVGWNRTLSDLDKTFISERYPRS